MSDLREWLQRADPVGSEPALAHEDVQRMRRAVLAAASEPSKIAGFRSLPWAVAVIGLITVLIAGTQSVRLRSTRGPGTSRAGSTDTVEPPVTVPKQLQFVTAGGTRVIWQFNDTFELEGSRR
jgi:hypothetical protein